MSKEHGLTLLQSEMDEIIRLSHKTVKKYNDIEDAQREQYLHNLRWEENMNHLYTWDEGGFCDGFMNQ